MKAVRWFAFAVAVAAINSQLAVRSQAGLFKMDFGTTRNLTAEGVPAGNAHENGAPVDIPDWDEFSTFCFEDTTACLDPNDPDAFLFPTFPTNEATWKLTDFSKDGDNDVTLTITDNVALSEEMGFTIAGMIHNNPVPQELDVTYDGVVVPAAVKDDYLYRNPDTAGSELLYRFTNLNPGKYNVTLFLGRTSDANGQFGKVWVESDITGKGEPAEQNTGSFAGFDPDTATENPEGNPKTIPVEIKAGEYLWFAHMEDNSGGMSGIIVRQTSGGVVGTPGDFDGDGDLDAADINALSVAVRGGTNPANFDLNKDNAVNGTDRKVWVNDLKKTYFGDANLDREFSSGDFVAVFTVGKYETGQSAEWQEGDWNGDAKFDSGDFVEAFTEGGYEKGPHPAVSSVPEPSGLVLLSLGALMCVRRKR